MIQLTERDKPSDDRPRLRGLVLTGVRAERDRHALTQKELAARAKVSLPTVIAAELGRPVNAKSARKIARALHVPVAKLMEAQP
jgi:transcriptional regulator with XRE-family HTH domain